MGRAGRAYVEEYFDNNKLNDQLVEIYQQLLLEQVLDQNITETKDDAIPIVIPEVEIPEVSVVR